MMIFLLFAVSAWCAQPTISDSANLLDDDIDGSQGQLFVNLPDATEEGMDMCSEGVRKLKVSYSRQDLIILPTVLRNTRNDHISVRPYQVRSECLPKGLRHLRCETEREKDIVLLYGEAQDGEPLDLKISLPHEGINSQQQSGCLLSAVTSNYGGNHFSQIMWCHKTHYNGDLLLHTPKEGVFTREFSWLFRHVCHDFSEYNFGLESLSITRVVSKYNDGSSVFVRAKVAYANLQEVTFSIGQGLVPYESLLLSKVVKL